MAHNRDTIPNATSLLADASKDIFNYAMPNAGVSGTTTLIGAVSRICRHSSTLFQEALAFKKIQTALLQAVIDHDQKTMTTILDSNLKQLPELLLLDPQYNIVIESQLTWQRFYAESPLTMAAKRKQINMIELLLPYYKMLEPTHIVEDSIAESLSAWKCYDMKKNMQGEDKIIIPKEYTSYFESLLNVISKETFPYGKLSEATEVTLSGLFKKLLPSQPLKLDEYLDVELFLLAACKAYKDANGLQTWEKSRTFCLRVISLIVSALSPETSAIWCEGLADVVNAIQGGEEIKISARAAEHKLEDGESFYRSSRDSQSGQGFDYVCGTWAPYHDFSPASIGRYAHRLETIWLSKNNKFLEKYAAIALSSKPASTSCRL